MHLQSVPGGSSTADKRPLLACCSWHDCAIGQEYQFGQVAMLYAQNLRDREKVAR